MSLTAATDLVRRLDRISTDLLRRPPGERVNDLLESAAGLERDVHAVGVPDLAGVWHLRMGEILYRAGRHAEAVTQARAALRALGSRREADLHVAALELQARCLDHLADWDALDATVEQGITIVERHRYSLSAPYLKTAYMRARIGLYALGVRSAMARGDLSAVIRRAELSKCRSFNPTGANPATSDEGRALEQRLRTLTERINRQQRDGQAPPQLLAERRMLWDRFVSAGHADEPAPVPDLDAVSAVLNDKEAVLYYYWVDRNQLLRLTFDRRHQALESVHVSDGQRQALDALAGALTSAGERIEKHVVDGIDAFRSVLWPTDATARAILSHANRLIISPHRHLHALPISALTVDEGFVIKRWSVRHVPNLAALLPRDLPEATAGGLLAVGVTQYEIPDSPLRDLPAAAAECNDVCALYEADGQPVARLLDRAAEEDAIAAAMQARPAVAHFACHGQSVEADTPLESCLYLNRSVLDGLEIPLMGDAPRTVVLSACGAGQRAIAGRGMAELPGDDLLGLQAAFFAGGTQAIVAPLYPVDDKVARPICTAFHKHHLAGQPADIALANAVREFIDNANMITRRRYFWAPFFLTALGPNAPERTTPTQ